MTVLGIPVSQSYDKGKKAHVFMFELLGSNFKKEIPSNEVSLEKKLISQVLKRAKSTIQQHIVKYLFKHRQSSGKYHLISPADGKKYGVPMGKRQKTDEGSGAVIIINAFLSQLYQGKDLDFFTNNDLALKLIE